MFWASTPAEFTMAVSGYNRANGSGVEPMTRERYLELEADNPPSYSLSYVPPAGAPATPPIGGRR